MAQYKDEDGRYLWHLHTVPAVASAKMVSSIFIFSIVSWSRAADICSSVWTEANRCAWLCTSSLACSKATSSLSRSPTGVLWRSQIALQLVICRWYTLLWLVYWPWHAIESLVDLSLPEWAAWNESSIESGRRYLLDCHYAGLLPLCKNIRQFRTICVWWLLVSPRLSIQKPQVVR